MQEFILLIKGDDSKDISPEVMQQRMQNDFINRMFFG